MVDTGHRDIVGSEALAKPGVVDEHATIGPHRAPGEPQQWRHQIATDRGIAGQCETFVRQGGHRHGPAFADLTEPQSVRYAHIRQKHFVEFSATAQLTQGPDVDARIFHVEQEVRQPPMLGHRRVGPCEQQPPVCEKCP
jgi:hypothetical protein